ncbi:MAG: hypothetical protein ACXVAI_04640 [Candidatus Limnocylindrales bacterium]
MAARLHLKPGLVPAADRLESSPDTVVVREPTIGSTSRSKGSLYAIVTATPGGNHADEATRLVAETIERQYYYDESAGIPICLEKAIRSANQRLRHGRESHGLARGAIGAAVAIVRGHELYVATIGDADAFLIRQARLLTLPEEERGEGLPNPDEAHVDVWRGDLLVGDTLLLVARNVTATVGTEELKNAAVTLHPQSAAEHMHHLFVGAGGDRSDALMVLEAAELPATRTERKLVPVRPAEPLAGAPDRSPIPLADPLSGAAAAVQGGARRAREAASDATAGLVDRLLDLLPRRRTRYRRVVPLADRTESHRRVAIAFLAFLFVVVALGLGAWFVGGALGGGDVSRVSDAERAIQSARSNADQVTQANLVVSDPERAQRLLHDAWGQLDSAAALGAPASALAPLRTQVQRGLDQLDAVTYTTSSTIVSFAAAATPVDLAGLIRGPDGAVYVIDRKAAAVLRIDLAARTSKVLFKKGAGGGKGIGTPVVLAPAGPDVLILDDVQGLWRWRPADAKGNGTLAHLRLGGTTALGNDVQLIAAYVRNADSGLYFFYAVDPSSKQILRYSPAADGSGYTSDPTDYLAAPTDVSGFKALYIDGDVYTLQSDNATRYNSGQASSFELKTPPDDGDVRPGHDYRVLAATGGKGQGRLWVWDTRHDRVVAFAKADGSYQGQFIVEAGGVGYVDVRGMAVVERTGGQAPVLVWATAESIMASPLEPAPEPGVSPSPSASGSAKPTAKPTAKPKATPTRKP